MDGWGTNDMNENEKYLMENTSYFNDPEEKKEQKRANYWESRIDELIISPFNENKWNRIWYGFDMGLIWNVNGL